MSETTAISFLDRSARPLTRLCTMSLMLAVTWLIIRLGNMTVDAAEVALARWSRGEVVDWAGIAAPLAGIATILTIILPFIVSLFRDRRIERVEEIRNGGGAPRASVPFGNGREAPLPPSSDASSGPTAEELSPEHWPRPAENLS